MPRGFRTRSQWIGLGTPLSINRKQFQFTHKWQTLPSLTNHYLGLSKALGLHSASGKQQNGKQRNCPWSGTLTNTAALLCLCEKLSLQLSEKHGKCLEGAEIKQVQRTLLRTATWTPCKKLCHRLRPFGLEKQWLKLSSAQQSIIWDIGSVVFNEVLVWKGYWIKENQIIKKCTLG